MEKTSFKTAPKSLLEENILDWNAVQKSFEKSYGAEKYSSWLQNINLVKE